MTKKGLTECKPEWNREAITVFSRLPSHSSITNFLSEQLKRYDSQGDQCRLDWIKEILLDIPKLRKVIMCTDLNEMQLIDTCFSSRIIGVVR